MIISMDEQYLDMYVKWKYRYKWLFKKIQEIL